MSDYINLTIEKLIYGGDGLARIPENSICPDKQGAIVFTPWTAPGDVIQAHLDFTKKPFKARAEKILNASPNRVEPQCSVFGQCGGCDWQHLDYQTQLEWKRNIVQETLVRIGKFSDINVLPTLSTNELHYRNKVQWQVTESGKLAYLSKDSHHKVEFSKCWIIAPILQTIAEFFQQELYQEFLVEHQIQKITARCNQENQLLLILHSHQLDAPDTAAFQALCHQLDTVLQSQLGKLQGVLWQDTQQMQCVFGEPTLHENFQLSFKDTHFSPNYQYQANSFFQVNSATANLMLQTAYHWLSELCIEPKIQSEKAAQFDSLLDLYGGVGTFGIALSSLFKKVTLVESENIATEDAEVNFKDNQVLNLEIITAPVEKVFNTLSTDMFNITVIDPPRRGCDKNILNLISNITQDAILYVSCDPTTLARDLKLLCEASENKTSPNQKRWQIAKIQPIDMFPQTYHIETMALLLPAQ